MARVLAAVRRFQWRHWLVVAAFVAAALFAGYHIAGVVRHVAYLYSQRNEPIAPWMTVAHVAAAYHVSPEVPAQALDVPPTDRRPLRLIAAMRGESFDAVRLRVEDAIARAKATPTASPSPSSARPPGAGGGS